MNCEYCGSPIPSNTASCPACGARCEVQPAPSANPAAPSYIPGELVDLYIVRFTGDNKIAAIQELRLITGWDLLKSKAAVEGNTTPIAFSISPAEADVLQARLTARGCSMTTKPADSALKAANPTKIHVPKKSGCLIMFAPLVAIAIWLLG